MADDITAALPSATHNGAQWTRRAAMTPKTGKRKPFALRRPRLRRPEMLRGIAGDWSDVEPALVTKVLVLALAVVAYQVFLNRPVAFPLGVLQVMNQWDAPHYLDLAQHGYQATGDSRFLLVFYPLYPLFIHAVARLLGDALTAAFAVSTVASLAAAMVLYSLARLDLPDPTARRSVWFLFIFPTSYFLHIGYTESLFLALTLGCFLAARSGRWLLAGSLGALAGLTRLNGLVLAPALAVEALSQWTKDRVWRWEWGFIGLVLAGFAGYLVLNYAVTGDPLRFLVYEHDHWSKSLAWPWTGIGGLIQAAGWRDPNGAQMEVWQEVLFMLIGLGGTLAAAVRLRPSYTVWMALNCLLFVSTSFVLSVPRYTLILFPLFLLFAELAERRTWNYLLTTWSLLFLSFFTVLFAQGRWAF
jgi:Gpi18-like mannosyltransferase